MTCVKIGFPWFLTMENIFCKYCKLNHEQISDIKIHEKNKKHKVCSEQFLSSRQVYIFHMKNLIMCHKLKPNWHFLLVNIVSCLQRRSQKWTTPRFSASDSFTNNSLLFGNFLIVHFATILLRKGRVYAMVDSYCWSGRDPLSLSLSPLWVLV